MVESTAKVVSAGRNYTGDASFGSSGVLCISPG
jgi:hypothetical protein